MCTRKRGRIREQKAIGKKGYKQNSNVSTYSPHSPDIIHHCILVCLSSYKSKYFGLHINLTGSSISGLTTYILKRIAAQIFPVPCFISQPTLHIKVNPNVLPDEHSCCAIGCFSVAVINIVDQKQRGEERFIIEGSQGRNWSRDHQPRDFQQKAGPSHSNHWSKKYWAGMLKSWPDGGDSSLGASSFQMILVCVKLTD